MLNQTWTIITASSLPILGFVAGRLSSKIWPDQDVSRPSNDPERLRLLTLLNSLSGGVLILDTKGRVVQHNEAAHVLAGGGELTGRHVYEALPVFRRDDPERKPVNVLEEGSPAQHRRDLWLPGKNDAEISLDISVTPIKSGKNRTTGYVVIYDDISRERTLEEQRLEFTSVASHEIRTPLAVIEVDLESALMSGNDLPPQVKTLLEQAHRNSLQLGAIIKDMTMIAQAQNDKIPVRLTQIDPGALLHECANDFMVQAQQKGLTLATEVKRGTPSILSTEHHIREILENYITNALKYSQKGTITLRVQPAAHAGVLFSVQDEGIGISPKDQRLLFTKFFRVEDYRTRSTSGTGLGLYLCMELAQRLGAKVWCKSILNQGSTFYLEVPQQSMLARDQGEVVSTRVENLVDWL